MGVGKQFVGVDLLRSARGAMASDTPGLGARVQRRVVGALMGARMTTLGTWSKVDQSTLWVGGNDAA